MTLMMPAVDQRTFPTVLASLSQPQPALANGDDRALRFTAGSWHIRFLSQALHVLHLLPSAVLALSDGALLNKGLFSLEHPYTQHTFLRKMVHLFAYMGQGIANLRSSPMPAWMNS